MAYNRVARGMLHEDKITYSILLARIYLKGMAKYVFHYAIILCNEKDIQ